VGNSLSKIWDNETDGEIVEFILVRSRRWSIGRVETVGQSDVEIEIVKTRI
jgi:hypothetical protein